MLRELRSSTESAMLPITLTDNGHPNAGQLAAWRALWRILLTPRLQPNGKEHHPGE